jgi:hypothetical protein
MTKRLDEYVGETIIIRSIPVNEQHPASVKLLAVDTGGIWIESQDITEHWLAQFKQTTMPKTFVWYLPYAQISWILGTEDYPSISEKSLGL